jgi:S1-C subfamily serine protease
MSAAHVVKNGSCVLKKDAADRFPSSVRVMYVDTFNDYAILQTRREQASHYTVDCSGYVSGDQYAFAGYPFGGTFRVDAGIAQPNDMGIRNENGTIRVVRNIAGLSIEGMSGGPVVNQNGQVVGLISGKMKAGPDQVVTVPITITTLCEGNGSAG